MYIVFWSCTCNFLLHIMIFFVHVPFHLHVCLLPHSTHQSFKHERNSSMGCCCVHHLPLARHSGVSMHMDPRKERAQNSEKIHIANCGATCTTFRQSSSEAWTLTRSNIACNSIAMMRILPDSESSSSMLSVRVYLSFLSCLASAFALRCW